MNFSSSFRIFLLVALTIPVGTSVGMGYGNNPCPRYSGHTDYWGAIGTAIAAVGAVAAGYGIYKFCDWAFRPSDQELLKRAYGAEQALLTYAGYASCVECHCQRSLAYNPVSHEPLLYELASTMRGSPDFIAIMGQTLESARTACRDLDERRHSISYTADRCLLEEMRRMVERLEGHIQRTEYAYTFLNQHQGYFTLFNTEQKVYREHECVLQCGSYDQARVMIVSVGSQSNTLYPLTAYANLLYRNISDLQYALSNRCLSYNYPQRISSAQQLLTHICRIYNHLLADDAYRQELRAAEYVRIEQERLAAEQRKAEALESQARQLREQTYQMQRQNELKAQELCVERERNAIMAAQTVVSVFNPPQSAQVNVFLN